MGASDMLRSALQRLAEIFRSIRATLTQKTGDLSTSEGRSRERYRRALLTTVASFGSRAIGLFTSLVSIPLTLKYLGTERYGLWMILTSIIAVLAFADLGIGNGLLNAVAEADGKDDRNLAREYVSSSFFLLVLVAGAFGILGSIAYPFIPWPRVFNVSSASVAVEGAKAFAVLFAWFLLSIPLGVVARIQSGLQRGYSSQIVSAGGNLVSLAGVLLAIHVKAGLPFLVFSSTAGSIIATVLNGIILLKRHGWLMPAYGSARMHSALKIFKVGLLFFVVQAAGAVGFNSDNVVIAQLLGAGAVASYAIPQKLFGYAAMVAMFSLGPLWPAYGEAISRGDIGWVKKTLRRSILLSVVFSGVLNLMLIAGGSFILRHWVGNGVKVSLSLLLLLGLWGVVSTVSSAFSMFVNAAAGGLLKLQAVMAASMAVVNILLSIMLTARIGIAGVVVGSIVSQVATTLIPTLFLLPRFMRRMTAQAEAPMGATVGVA